MSHAPRCVLKASFGLHGHGLRLLLVASVSVSAVLLAPRPMALAAPPESVARGGQLFLGNGCGACHTIRGTAAHGAIGPDLTHVGSRLTVGAGLLPNTERALASFIARPDRLKSGIKMPNFDMLPPADIEAIAAYLKALQ
jgi:cytochrome c1